MIDLHSHTTASDGTCSPKELVGLAAAAGTTILAVTDHDTVAGLEAARQAAEETGGGLRLIPGIELSARWGRREIHILGHFIDPTDERLLDHLRHFAAARLQRMESMVARARSLGIDVSMDELEGAGEGTVGRPHLARLLVKKGRARDVQDAFDRWLGKSGPLFVERALPEAREAISLIRSAGGAASLAHPALSHLQAGDVEALADRGLSGIEVLHPGHGPEARAWLRQLASRLGLCATAGSDFHTPGDGEERLGSVGMDEASFVAYEARAARAPIR